MFRIPQRRRGDANDLLMMQMAIKLQFCKPMLEKEATPFLSLTKQWTPSALDCNEEEFVTRRSR